MKEDKHPAGPRHGPRNAANEVQPLGLSAGESAMMILTLTLDNSILHLSWWSSIEGRTHQLC